MEKPEPAKGMKVSAALFIKICQK